MLQSYSVAHFHSFIGTIVIFEMCSYWADELLHTSDHVQNIQVQPIE